MADKHPYVSAPGSLIQVIVHFRKSFPATITAETLKKLGFAPNNESYILSVLRFLGIIDEAGKKIDTAAKTFNTHDDGAFSQEFSKLVKKSYSDLFEHHAEDSWALDTDQLITFFRSTDDTSAVVGKYQARTFRVLAAFSGHGDMPASKLGSNKAASSVSKTIRKVEISGSKKAKTVTNTAPPTLPEKLNRNFGMTVRVEINLPADGNQETYDRIFKSIRENFLND